MSIKWQLLVLALQASPATPYRNRPDALSSKPEVAVSNKAGCSQKNAFILVHDANHMENCLSS
jgi:hypothetical protein